MLDMTSEEMYLGIRSFILNLIQFIRGRVLHIIPNELYFGSCSFPLSQNTFHQK